jgi:hypothetical protein
LDLEISISKFKIITSTYQKPINLYLYIPALSAHPPSCCKALINGECKRHWTQNTPEDYQQLLQKFIKRLVHRGHSIANISPLLIQVAATLDANLSTTSNKKENVEALYIHWSYHPKDLQRRDIRVAYNAALAPILS